MLEELDIGHKSLNVLDATVSRRHVVFEVERGRILFWDHGGAGRGSINGTIVNGIVLRGGVGVEAPGTGALGVGGLVIDYRVGGVEPGVLLVSVEKGGEERVAPPSWRVYVTAWLPRMGPRGVKRMRLLLALGMDPRGAPLDYEARAAFFARVAAAAGDRLEAEKATYAATYCALRLQGMQPALDVVRERAERLLRLARAA